MTVGGGGPADGPPDGHEHGPGGGGGERGEHGATDGHDERDDAPIAPLLPPDDRIWRHPSEMGRAASAAFRSPARPRWPIVMLAAAIGALFATGLAAATNGFSHAARVGHPATTPVGGVSIHTAPPASAGASRTGPGPGPIAAGASLAQLADRVHNALVAVRVTHNDGTKTTVTGLVLGVGDDVVATADQAMQEVHTVGVVGPGPSAEETPASIAGRDGDTGIALVRAPGLRSSHPGLDAITLASASPPAVPGQVTLAVSADASGGRPALAIGTVRGLNRQVTGVGGVTLMDVIETDVPVQSAAGALLLDGAGAPTAMALAVIGDGADRRCYAAPLGLVRDIAGQLAAAGRVPHAWLGVEGGDLAPTAASALGVPGGAQLSGVQPGSPAATAGLEDQDVVRMVDSRPIGSMLELRASIRLRHPGDSVALVIVRHGQQRTVRATLAPRPPSP